MAQIEKLLTDIDYALAAAGALLAMALMTRWWRAGRRDPLRGSPLRPNRLSVLHVWLCLAANILAWSAGGRIGAALAPQGLKGDGLLNWQGAVGSVVANSVTILTCLLIAKASFAGGLAGAGIGRRSLRYDLVAGAVGVLLAITLTDSMVHATNWTVRTFFPSFQPREHSVFQLLKDQSTGPVMRVMTLLGAAILAPIGEELMFRGILQTGIRRLIPPRRHSLAHRWVAVVSVGVLFGAVHSTTPQNVPALAALGILLGGLYERTGSLRACMLVHMLFNGRSLLWESLVRHYSG